MAQVPAPCSTQQCMAALPQLAPLQEVVMALRLRVPMVVLALRLRVAMVVVTLRLVVVALRLRVPRLRLCLLHPMQELVRSPLADA